MHTGPPVLTALHSAYVHLTSVQAFARTHPQSACKDLQLRVLAMQVIVHAPPAFHLFYGEPGWQGATIHMRLTCKQHTQVCTLPQQQIATHSFYLHSCSAMLDCFSGVCTVTWSVLVLCHVCSLLKAAIHARSDLATASDCIKQFCVSCC